jgi:hypothetical protein
MAIAVVALLCIDAIAKSDALDRARTIDGLRCSNFKTVTAA